MKYSIIYKPVIQELSVIHKIT